MSNRTRMRESISWTISTAMENSHGLLETGTKETTWMMRGMAMVRCIGLMEVCTKANGQKEYSMVTEKCTFQTALIKSASLRITCSRELQTLIKAQELEVRARLISLQSGEVAPFTPVLANNPRGPTRFD